MATTKTITRHFDGGFVKRINSTFKELYDNIRKTMPLSVRWIVDTGKTKRLYFWFYGNQYQGNQLCWSQIN